MISAGHKTGPVSLAVVSGALLLLYVFRHITHRTSAGDLISLGDKQNAKWLAQHVTVRHEVIGGSEVVIANISRPSAVLLVFHGCSHSATDWWFPSSGCAKCQGLPEEVGVTKTALQKGWAVVAFSSTDRRHKCWDSAFPPERSADTQAVVRAFETLSKREGWQKLPTYALGGSSGGAFALHLAMRLPLKGLCIQLMAVPSEHLLLPKGLTFPPTAFVHMSRDGRTAEGVKGNIDVLKTQGVKVKEVAIAPLPLTPTFMTERVDFFGSEQSIAVFEALKEGGALDQSGFLITDPRASRPHMSKSSWQSLVRERLPDLPVEADVSALAEEMNVAWAMHELVSDRMDEVFLWLEQAAGG